MCGKDCNCNQSLELELKYNDVLLNNRALIKDNQRLHNRVINLKRKLSSAKSFMYVL